MGRPHPHAASGPLGAFLGAHTVYGMHRRQEAAQGVHVARPQEVVAVEVHHEERIEGLFEPLRCTATSSLVCISSCFGLREVRLHCDLVGYVFGNGGMPVPVWQRRRCHDQKAHLQGSGAMLSDPTH